MNLRYFTWEEFDEVVEKTPRPVAHELFPLPRGGLVYAVALSHKFGLPLTSRASAKSIFIDDIADSGRTALEARIKYANNPIHCIFKKTRCKERGVFGIIEDDTDDWIVFPWENKDKAQEDYEQYIAGKRNI